MAREIRIPYPTGFSDLYLRFFNAAGQYRRGDTGAYESFNASNIALYGADAGSGTPYHVATEDGTTGSYFATLPDDTARSYGVYRQAGASPAQSDVEVAAGDVSVNVSQIEGGAATDAIQAAAAAAITAASLPTAAQIDTQLSGTHGTGSWATATSVAVSDKTGFKLASDGLDAIADPDDLTPGVVPTTFTQKLRWLIQRFWKAEKTATTITVKNEAGQTITSQAITSSGDNETLGTPS